MSIEKAIQNAVASVQIEGFITDAESVNWCKELLEGKIDLEQYILLAKKKAGIMK